MQRITAPQDPATARLARLRAEQAKAKNRAPNMPRASAERDQLIDLLLDAVTDLAAHQQ